MRHGAASPTAVIAMLAMLAACNREASDPPATPWAEALRQAKATDALVAVHFRLAGRPLSDAMDHALTPERLQQIAPEFVHLRLEASAAPELFARWCGGSTRRGAGLATCVVDAGGDAIACAFGHLTQDGVSALLSDATRLHRDLRTYGSVDSPRRELALAAHFARLGRRDVARARAAAVFERAPSPWRAHAAGDLARYAVEDGDLLLTRHWLAHADRQSPHVRLTAAMLDLAARQPRLALPALTALAVAAAEPERPAILLHLGLAQHATGDDAAALATFDLLGREAPDSTPAREAAQHAAHVRAGDHGHSHDAVLPP